MEGEKKLYDTVVLVMGNQKGGVGKSTNTAMLASAFGQLGHPTLVVDLDMTSGLSKMLGVPTVGWAGAYHLLTGQGDPLELIIDENESELSLPKGVHLICSSRELSELDNWLAKNPFISAQNLLIDPIEKFRGRYKYIILDTPPQTTRTIIPALMAADYAILSTMPDALAVKAMNDAVRDLVSAKKLAKARVMLLGVIMCTIPAPMTRLARTLIAEVTESLFDANGRSQRFNQMITRTVTLQQAQASGKSVFDYAPEHTVCDEYLQLATEVAERIKLLRTADVGEVIHG